MIHDSVPNVRFLRRCGAMAYDWIIIVAILMLWTFLWAILGGFLGEKSFFYYHASQYLIVFSYFTGFWCYRGQTVGMAIWKIYVVGDGRPLNWRMALSRFTCAIVSVLCLGAGFWWSLLRDDRRAWHDHYSDSYLIRV